MSFFNNPNRGSFKDWLAGIFTVVFLAAAVKYMMGHQSEDLLLVSTLIPIISIILIGYFGQEVSTAINESKQKVQLIKGEQNQSGEPPI